MSKQLEPAVAILLVALAAYKSEWTLRRARGRFQIPERIIDTRRGRRLRRVSLPRESSEVVGVVEGARSALSLGCAGRVRNAPVAEYRCRDACAVALVGIGSGRVHLSDSGVQSVVRERVGR